jgi:hypothetical protein
MEEDIFEERNGEIMRQIGEANVGGVTMEQVKNLFLRIQNCAPYVKNPQQLTQIFTDNPELFHKVVDVLECVMNVVEKMGLNVNMFEIISAVLTEDVYGQLFSHFEDHNFGVTILAYTQNNLFDFTRDFDLELRRNNLYRLMHYSHPLTPEMVEHCVI